MLHLLFIYGTLHPDRAPAEIADVARRLTLVGPATVLGTLLDLGAYPGLLLGAGDEIRGNVFALPEPAHAAWARLDAYEDFRPGDPAASLFVRQPTTAKLAGGAEIGCFVYVYNRRA